MQNLTISLIQSNLVWENIDENLGNFASKINSIEQTDLIILPETFSTGFSMNSKEIAEPMAGKAVSWMKEMAIKTQAVICGSLILKAKNKIYNRFIWMRPDGTFEKYDKRHLFTMGNESIYFSKGKKQLIIDLKGWKIAPQICYDLRFPVFSRNQSANPYDLLIYVANWPEARITAWEKLLYARAIENQCYVVAVNRIGVDGLGVNCIGNSLVIDSKGGLFWKAADNKEEIKTITLSKIELESFRKKFPVLADGDQFEIK